MKRPPLPVIAMVAFGVIGLAAWLFWPKGGDRPLTGYVEGEALYFAAPVSGTVTRLAVERGAVVPAGTELFQIDPGTSEAQRLQAEAQARAAAARAEDATKGQRPAELSVIQAQRASASARLEEARLAFERVRALAAKGFAAPAQLDQARAQYRTAQAQYAQASRQLDVAELGARSDQAAAAAAEAQGAGAAVAEADLRLNQLSPRAPSAGRIEEVFFRQGEWAPANQPVLSLLPDARVKIRFFVPETAVAAYRAGKAVRFTCDGCQAQNATISYVSPRPEFTPPVIYSRGARERLVFLVEARPERPAVLAPGQPVDVTPLEP
ncbi:MAG: HlyD family efflux transporter periplasmic adaptor subunit [Caulobacteraceae bacterium]|nr:HlyD family efflux transporter periplasmic adaptor subunit [Caulobacteraceae bacterium]